MDDDKRPVLLTAGQVARLFQVDPKTVARWAATGKIPCITLPSGHRRYREADIQAWLNGQGGSNVQWQQLLRGA